MSTLDWLVICASWVVQCLIFIAIRSERNSVSDRIEQKIDQISKRQQIHHQQLTHIAHTSKLLSHWLFDGTPVWRRTTPLTSHEKSGVINKKEY